MSIKNPTCPNCTGSLDPDWIMRTAMSIAGSRRSEAKAKAAQANATAPRPNRRKTKKTK
jgi:hypothetical protein